MKISIVTAYYNRKELFVETLKTIAATLYKDFEVIAVDDASKQEERIEDLIFAFPFLKVIRVEKKDKWYYNSGIPNNMGIAKASGDIIILQNPECLHVSDVISYMAVNVNNFNYVSASTYGIGFGWYNHYIHRPIHYPFCAAMTMENMRKLGGFDERYAMGIGYDDNDFVDRIDRLGLQKLIVNDILVLHQQHPKVYNLLNTEHAILYDRNARLHKQTKCEKTIRVRNRYE